MTLLRGCSSHQKVYRGSRDGHTARRLRKICCHKIRLESLFPDDSFLLVLRSVPYTKTHSLSARSAGRLVQHRPALRAHFFRLFDCLHSLCVVSLYWKHCQDETPCHQHCTLCRERRRAWSNHQPTLSKARAVDDSTLWADCFRHCQRRCNGLARDRCPEYHGWMSVTPQHEEKLSLILFLTHSLRPSHSLPRSPIR